MQRIRKRIFLPVLLKGVLIPLALALSPHGGGIGEAGSSGEMVFIPEGEFIMGSQSPEDGKTGFDYGVDEEPRHKVYLKAFYIDKYETTLSEFREYLKATGKEWLGDSYISEEYPSEPHPNIPDPDRSPVNYVSWEEAKDFCTWKGKRLPTEPEWEKAARGADGRRWPWGNVFDPQKANVEEKGEGWITPIGGHPEDKGPYGIYDMGGNVSEWTASHYLPYPGNKYDDGRYSKKAYVLKGGSFLLPGRLYGRGAARSLAYPAYRHRMFGFRCAKDAP